LHVGVSSLWADAVTLLFAIAVAAAYASVINDIRDRADDERADGVIDNTRAARAAGNTTGSRTQSPFISGVGDTSIGISPLGS
jgi:hypothetical protein